MFRILTFQRFELSSEGCVLLTHFFLTCESKMARKREHTEKTLKVKYEALLELEKGASNKAVADRFGIPKNTLSTWKKNKDKIMQAYHGGHVAKRVKPETYELVNKALLKWFTTMRSENVPISGPILKEKACDFAKEMGIGNFQASEGWLEKWKKRYVYRVYSIYFC